MRIAGHTLELWEWFNDLERNDRLIRIRTLMQEVAWAKPGTFPNQQDYQALAKGVFERVAALARSHPVLEGIQPGAVAADGSGTVSFERGVRHEEVPVEPGKKASGRRTVFSPEGVLVHLTFYRGAWEGQAAFEPLELGDLKLWVRVAGGEQDRAAAAVWALLRAEKRAFDRKYPGLSLPLPARD